jgi:HEAT repeat protein
MQGQSSVALVVGLWALFLMGQAVASDPNSAKPTYDGMPLRHWIVATSDSSVAMRCDAIRVLERLTPDLILALKNYNVGVRSEAVRALEKLGPASQAAVPVLRKLLRDPDRSVRLQAACALAFISPSQANEAMPILIEALPDATAPNVTAPNFYPAEASALRLLGRTSTAPIDALTDALKDPRSCLLAALTLGLIGPPARDAIPQLVAARDQPNAGLPQGTVPKRHSLRTGESQEVPLINFRLTAARALIHIDPALAKDAIPLLKSALQHPNNLDQAMGMIAEIGPLANEAIPNLVAALKKEKRTHPFFPFLDALSQVGPAAGTTLPALLTMVKDPESDWRYDAILTVGMMGPGARKVLPSLVAILNQPASDEALIEFAAVAVAHIDPPQAEGAVWILVAEDDFLALQALAAMGPHARQAAPALLRSLGDLDVAKGWLRDHTSCWKLTALARIDPSQVRLSVPKIVRKLTDPNESPAGWLRALNYLGPAAREAIPSLVDQLQKPLYRVTAVRALGQIGPAAEKATPALIAVVANPKERERRAKRCFTKDLPRPELVGFGLVAALRSEEIANNMLLREPLESVESVSMHDALLELLTDPETHFSRRAVQALGRIGVPAKEAVSALLTARRDPDPGVRLAAACALAHCQPDQATDVVPALIKALNDPDWAVRGAAAQSLGIIGGPAKKAGPALQLLLQDPIRLVRQEAATALREVDPETAKKADLPATQLQLLE